MRLEGSVDDVMVRLPQPPRVQFPPEQTLREAATAMSIAAHTAVPVPRVLCYGSLTTPDPRIEPFHIVKHIENAGTMSHVLAKPPRGRPHGI